MEDLSLLMNGFATVLSWQNIGLMAIGILLGIVVGVLPGLGGPNGVAILLPLTFTMNPTSEKQDAAWEFMKFRITDGAQYYLSVRLNY